MNQKYELKVFKKRYVNNLGFLLLFFTNQKAFASLLYSLSLLFRVNLV